MSDNKVPPALKEGVPSGSTGTKKKIQKTGSPGRKSSSQTDKELLQTMTDKEINSHKETDSRKETDARKKSDSRKEADKSAMMKVLTSMLKVHQEKVADAKAIL